MKLLTISTHLAVIIGLFLSGVAPAGAENEKNAGSGRPLQVLKSFPLDASAYQGPAAALVQAGIPAKFGQEEWAAVVLSHEFHQHVGIYTVIGAKMGVRARELLKSSARAVKVKTETGDAPPLACVIDGLQVALGSTLAQGLIAAPPTTSPQVAATFEYREQVWHLRLKPEAAQKIAAMIQAAIKSFGDLTPAYFQEIERQSYQVWAEFDRRQIFTETCLTDRTPAREVPLQKILALDPAIANPPAGKKDKD